MSTTTIRVQPETYRRIAELARGRRKPISRILDEAVDLLERRCLLEAINDGYRRIRSDASARAALDREQDELDGTLGDGLDEDPWPSTPVTAK